MFSMLRSEIGFLADFSIRYMDLAEANIGFTATIIIR